MICEPTTVGEPTEEINMAHTLKSMLSKTRQYARNSSKMNLPKLHPRLGNAGEALEPQDEKRDFEKHLVAGAAAYRGGPGWMALLMN